MRVVIIQRAATVRRVAAPVTAWPNAHAFGYISWNH
jgi:hypothetical protein